MIDDFFQDFCGTLVAAPSVSSVERERTEKHLVTPVIPEPRGETYEPLKDKVRLNKQYKRVWNLMSDGKARTLREIENETGDPQASISARLREIGVEKKRRNRGAWEYWII